MKKNMLARGRSSVPKLNANYNSYKLPKTLMRNYEDETQSCANHVLHKVMNINASIVVTPMLMATIPLHQLHHVCMTKCEH